MPDVPEDPLEPLVPEVPLDPEDPDVPEVPLDPELPLVPDVPLDPLTVGIHEKTPSPVFERTYPAVAPPLDPVSKLEAVKLPGITYAE